MAVGWYFKYRRRADIAIAAVIVLSLKYSPLLGFEIFHWVDQKDVIPVYQSIFSVSASLLGFVLASATFLFAHVQAPAYKILRESRSYPDLLNLFGAALWRLAFVMIVSAAGMQSRLEVLDQMNTVVLFTSIWATLAVLSLLWITLKILRVPT